MKNTIYLLSFLFVFSLNAQKNKNGTIYGKHPGIEFNKIDFIDILNHVMV